MNSPWKTGDAPVAHPNAPDGGGGVRRGRSPGSYGTGDEGDEDSLPHPDSPMGRHLNLDHRKVRKVVADTGRARPHQRVWHDSDDLNEQVRKEAEGYVGKPTVGDGECATYPDKVLGNLGAKSAPDFSGRITPNGDYAWGRKLDKVSEIKPGDIVQFRDHLNMIETATRTVTHGPTGGTSTKREAEKKGHKRGHHTAIVLAVNGDGSFVVAEQHVIDASGALSKTVRRNTVWLESKKGDPVKTVREVGGSTLEIFVTTNVEASGKFWAYRPQPGATTINSR